MFIQCKSICLQLKLWDTPVYKYIDKRTIFIDKDFYKIKIPYTNTNKFYLILLK